MERSLLIIRHAVFFAALQKRTVPMPRLTRGSTPNWRDT